MRTKTTARDQRIIAKARKIREKEHRLRSDLRLKTTSDMVDFVHQKSLVSALGGNELPSMISAVLGRTWRPSSKGFTGWLEWWSLKVDNRLLARVVGELERREDILASRIFRRSKTLVSNRLWPTLSSIAEHHAKLLTSGEILSGTELKLREIIKSEGEIRTDRLRKQAQLEGKENNYKFHHSLATLEGYGLIVGAEDPQPEKHMHANIWQTWQKRAGGKTNRKLISYEDALTRLLEKTVEASVLVREDMAQELYQWSGRDMTRAKETLIDRGAIARVGEHLIPSRIIKNL